MWPQLGLGEMPSPHPPTNPMPELLDPAMEAARELEEVRRLVGRLSRRSKVRHAAEALLADPDTPVADFEAVLYAVGKPHGYYGWREAAVASWVLGAARLTEVQRRLAVKALSEVAAHGMRYTLMGGLAQSAKRSALMGMSVVLTFTFSPRTRSPIILHDHTGSICVREAAVRALGRMAAVEALEAISSALFDGLTGALFDERRVGKAAEKSLVETLPYVTEAWYSHLSARTMANLIKALKHHNDGLVLATLRALEQAGDGSAVEPVRKLTKFARVQVVEETAQAVLPVLLERQRKEQLAGSLLRPVGGSVDAESTLLRPVHGRACGDESQLLRAGQEGGGRVAE